MSFLLENSKRQYQTVLWLSSLLCYPPVALRQKAFSSVARSCQPGSLSLLCLTFSMALRIIRTFLALSSLFLGGNCIQIWSSPGALPTAIPASCRAALSTNITCSPDLVSARFISSGRSLDNAILNQYCTPTCASSLMVIMFCELNFMHFASLRDI